MDTPSKRLYNLHFINIIREIKSRIIWAGHGKESNAYDFSQNSLRHLVVNATDLNVNEMHMDRGNEYVNWVHKDHNRP